MDFAPGFKLCFAGLILKPLIVISLGCLEKAQSREEEPGGSFLLNVAVSMDKAIPLYQ